jgi:polyhydroxyalkanoate synthesis regulator phasin
MKRPIARLSTVVAISLVALLAIGATVASAHRGAGRGAKAANASALVTRAAKQLDVTRAKLAAAIEDAAVARIDEAVDDGDIDADEAEELKEEAQDNLRYAMALSRTKAVASNLGITTAKLNTAFKAARKALALARIDKAVAGGDLTEEEAAEAKQELEDATFPGYKAGVGGGFGLGGPGGCPRPGGGR